jgi:flagella basal body P-ring formation protein FlgA
MKSMDRVILSFVLALVLAAPAGRAVAGDAEGSPFQLQAEAKVDGAGIYLNQLLIPPPHATLPKLRLAQSPILGQTMSLSRQQIIALAKDAVPALNTTNWSGPELVRISRRVRQLCEADVLEMLRAALQKDYAGGRGTLEIHFTRPWQDVTMPEEPISLQLGEIPTSGILPSMVAGFELWCGKERLGAWQAPLQAHIWRDMPVAHSPVLRGQLLRDADITLERRDVLVQRDDCIEFPVTESSLEAACAIQAGAPICTHLTRARSVLKKGQLVDAIFKDGPMTISLKVEAMEDGAQGQTVRVRNPKTRRELYGKIQTQDLVLIAL